MSEPARIHDFIAVGVGPFNLGLACLASAIEGLDGLFLDQKAGFDWHPGLMFDDAHLQTPFLSDLVTLADPTHPLSFLNYLKQQGRIYAFYIRENFFLLRREYNHYCQWAAAQIDGIRWNSRVEEIRHDPLLNCYLVRSRDTRSGMTRTDRARHLVLGTGPAPWWPNCCDAAVAGSDSVHHASRYLDHRESLKRLPSVALVGGGQSAAEIFVDLLQDIDRHDYTLYWVTRSPRFVPLEYTKLTLEMTSPEYVRYFHDLPPPVRDTLIARQGSLYKGINGSLINDIHELLYQKRLALQAQGKDIDRRVRMFTNSALCDLGRAGDGLRLALHHQEQGRGYALHAAGIVLATGYRYAPPAFLLPIAHRLRLDGKGRFDVAHNYSIDRTGREIFVQNAELHTHGFVTPDLGMACYRNAHILRAITGVDHYPIETRIAFQEFGVPPDLATDLTARQQVAS
ncbi:MAG: lysine N(6)-hydroxylase/L-ornithine N(5)-oxygenase family protein [Pseudomonadota bacterium]